MADHGGAVVDMSSNSGILAAKGISYNNITKSAVIYPTRQHAVELAADVRVNAVAPRFVRTDMARNYAQLVHLDGFVCLGGRDSHHRSIIRVGPRIISPTRRSARTDGTC